MPAIRSLVACAALAALMVGEVAAAQNADCLSEREVTNLVSYALPVVMDSAIKTCRPQLAPDGYFATQGASLVQRYAARKSTAWPDAKAALLKLGGKDDKMKDMVANLSDEALQPFADGLVAQLIASASRSSAQPACSRLCHRKTPRNF